MSGPDSSDLIIREPSALELPRVLHLFRSFPLPRQARVFVAVKMKPLERFVAAAAWWPKGDLLLFRLAFQPGSSARLAACSGLIQQLTECGRALGVRCMNYSDLLADNSEWIPILLENGFTLLHSERFFEVSALESWTRTIEIAERMRDKFPPGWRTESIRHHRPEAILELIEPHRLMPSDELCERWGEGCPCGFELDLSAILFDGARPVGAFLMRPVLDALYVDVRVVQAGSRLLNSLGNVALLRHTAVIHGVVGRNANRRQFNHLQFRGGELEHRETANLALRMGGSELPSRHIFTRTF